jgi:hypothetical protein
MRNIVRTAAAATLVGAVALASVTPTFARDWGRTGAAAGIGFAAGAIVGSSIASQNRAYYYGPGYYEPGYAYGSTYYYGPGYAYEPVYGPAYAYEEPAYTYRSRHWSGRGSATRQLNNAERSNPGH